MCCRLGSKIEVAKSQVADEGVAESLASFSMASRSIRRWTGLKVEPSVD